MNARIATAFVIALICDITAWAQTSSLVPKSAEEALENLRHTQAADADWSSFPDVTSTLSIVRGREGTRPPIDAEIVVFLHRNSDGTVELEVLKPKSRTHASFDRPELDASRATFVRNETITAAGRTFATKVYRFTIETKRLDGSVFQATHTYWLAGGVPSGVVRHESVGADSDAVVTPGGAYVSVISELDVPFTVQGRVLHTYCRTGQMDWPDGTSDKTRQCKHESVPGGNVREESRTTKNGVEIRSMTVDLDEMTVPLPPSSVPNTDFGCTFPASMVGDSVQALLEAGEFTQAIASLNAWIRVDPKCARAFNDRGYAKLQLKDKSGAMADLDRATQLEPKLLMAYVNRAVIKREDNNLKGALAECNEALKIDPKSYVALVNRMTIYFRLFEDKRAIDDYELALKMLPSGAASLDRVVARERARRQR